MDTKETFKISNLLTVVASLGLLVSSLAGIIALQYPAISNKQKTLSWAEYQTQEAQDKLSLRVLNKIPTLGFSNLIADWLYLNFIQYFGDTKVREEVGYSLTNDYFNFIVNKDPLFVDALYHLDIATSLFAGLPKMSVNNLTKALNTMPPKFITNIEPYYLWRAKGNDELLFLGDINATKTSYQKSLDWAKYYNTEDARKMIGINQQSLQFLSHNPDSKQAQIGAWASVLANRPDQKTIKRVIEKIEQLGGQVTFMPDGKITVSLSGSQD
ncbi:hypothetical protein [Synechocystis sp. LKSZ1]|uniref:hypothetical protein n=1 Tax=Synechocystis sp. LKSZ1 TaxID=3144951 RepID=UPI00336BDDA4